MFQLLFMPFIFFANTFCVNNFELEAYSNKGEKIEVIKVDEVHDVAKFYVRINDNEKIINKTFLVSINGNFFTILYNEKRIDIDIPAFDDKTFYIDNIFFKIRR